MIRWSIEEIELVQKNLNKGSRFIAALILSEHNIVRSQAAIRDQVLKRGWKLKNIPSNHWTKKEIQLLNEHRKKGSLALSKIINRTPRAIRAYAKRLGITTGDGSNQIYLEDGRIISRSELMRLNRMDHKNITDPAIKQAIEHIASIEEKIYQLTKEK